MRLSKLYTNRFDVFEPIKFNAGLNVVLAEIRLPENRKKDTHNLGKTTLGQLLDFGLLAGKKQNFFLFKHPELFREFVFFLEIETLDGTFVTVRRSVEHHSRIAFKRHAKADMDLTDLPEASWDHTDVPFENARALLDAILDLRDLSPWGYRKVVGYLVRSQYDFEEVYQLRKVASAHKDWKPFVAHLLGFDGDLLTQQYAKEGELDEKQGEEHVIERELGGSIADLSKIEGMLLLKQKDAERRQLLLDAFDFRQADKQETKVLVDDLDTRIGQLNAERYSLAQAKKKIAAALGDDEILFDPDRAAEVFNDAGVLFAGQLKKDFEQLIAFNRAITEERSVYLKEELTEVEEQLRKVNADLQKLGKRRSETLSFLSETDVFAKYKVVTDELVRLRADITSLERQRAFLHRLQELRATIRRLAEQRDHLRAKIETDLEQQNSEPASLFSSIRVFFSEIVEEVINRKALLSVFPNHVGHLDFRAEILDDSGSSTSADLGNTYRKLLCVAFDLALTRGHLPGRYPRFLFHDGVLESLDDRKKHNLLEVIRAYCDLGIQHIVTAIDSDLPRSDDDGQALFSEAEIVLRLHDEGDDGRLFKMKSW